MSGNAKLGPKVRKSKKVVVSRSRQTEADYLYGQHTSGIGTENDKRLKENTLPIKKEN